MGLKSINVYLPNGPEAIGAGIPALNIAVYLSVFALVYWFVWAFIAVRIRRQRELVSSISICFLGADYHHDRYCFLCNRYISHGESF